VFSRWFGRISFIPLVVVRRAVSSSNWLEIGRFDSFFALASIGGSSFWNSSYGTWLSVFLKRFVDRITFFVVAVATFVCITNFVGVVV